MKRQIKVYRGKREFFLEPSRVFFLLLVACFCLGLGGAVYEKTKEGNQLWHQGKYQDAFARYTEALSLAKTSEQSQLHYNLGTSLYKQEKYEDAVKEFEQALASSDSRLKEKIYYNLGNCYFRTGIAQKNIELLKKSAENYQKALELDPNDQEAKHNLEVVRRHIKLQMQNPPPPQPQPQPQQNQASASQNQQEQKKQEQSKQSQTSSEEKEQKQEQKSEAGGQTPKELSKEEAERILKALSEQEKEELKKLMKIQAVNQPSGKDW